MDEALINSLAESVQEVELSPSLALLLPFVERFLQALCLGIVEQAVQSLFPLVLGEQAGKVSLFFELAVNERVFIPFGAGKAGLKLGWSGEGSFGLWGVETRVLFAKLAEEVEFGLDFGLQL